jgi:RNA polymerase sigma-70 factor (ECF subfamily)
MVATDVRSDRKKCDQSAGADVIRVMPDGDPPSDDGGLVVTPESQGADDAQRFTALYREHHGCVRDFARRRVGADQAQEIVAETFLVAWRRFEDVPMAPIPWLYRIALYEIANLRRRQASVVRLHHALLETRTGAPAESGPYEHSDLGHAVAVAFATLKPRDQEILRLAAWEQVSTTEGAAVLQCSVSAYRMRLHRARIRLATKAGARERAGRPSRAFTETPPTALSGVVTRRGRTLEGTELLL